MVSDTVMISLVSAILLVVVASITIMTTQLGNRIEGVERGLGARIDDMNGRLTGVEHRLTGVEQGLGEVRERLTSLEVKLGER